MTLLRVYVPSQQGLRHSSIGSASLDCILRVYVPSQQGLRRTRPSLRPRMFPPQSVCSITTRIKTWGIPLQVYLCVRLRVYVPSQQGLRHQPQLTRSWGNAELRVYVPSQQGLRRFVFFDADEVVSAQSVCSITTRIKTNIIEFENFFTFSECMFHHNKD